MRLPRIQNTILPHYDVETKLNTVNKNGCEEKKEE